MKFITGILLLVLVGGSVLTGCGQKGDLYLPEPTPPPTPTKQP